MSSQLKRLKYPHGDLFVIDALDAIVKDDMTSMEHPFYALSKKPVREMASYEHNGIKIEFQPSHKGFPTIYDKDLIIYAISHVIAAIDEGDEPPREVEFNPYDFLVFTQRGTGGRDYDALCDSIDRLNGSYFRTNVKINGKIIDEWRGIIDGAHLETNALTKKPKKLRIKLSDMVLETIRERNVLTLNRDYFRLRKPIERRIYEIARKHLGQQKKWPVYVKTLHKKSGSRSSLREFRRAIKNLLEHNHLPDFLMSFDGEKDQITFTPRPQYTEAFLPKSEAGKTLPPLSSWAYEKARDAAPGQDIHALENEWRSYWVKKGCPDLDNPEAAYIGFCQRHVGQGDLF